MPSASRIVWLMLIAFPVVLAQPVTEIHGQEPTLANSPYGKHDNLGFSGNPIQPMNSTHP